MMGIANRTSQRGVPRIVIDYQGPTTTTHVNALPDAEATTVNVFVPTTEDIKTYNYHPSAIQHSSTGRIYISHTQHGRNEEGKGSYAVGKYSDDNGDTWTDLGVLMPSMETYDVAGTYSGPRPLTTGWVEIDGVCYALMDCVTGVSASRAQVGLFAVPVTGATVGDPALIYPPDWTAVSGFPQYEYDADLAGQILREINLPWGLPWGWGTNNLFPNSPAISTGRAVEHSKIKTDKGWLRFSRGVDTEVPNVLWVAASADGVIFGDAVATTMPDAPSKTCIRKFSDRYVFLGHPGTRASIFIAYSNDGITWLNSNCYKLRTGMTSSPVWAGTGKSGGGSYQDVIELQNGDYLAVYGERGKEIISVSRWTPEAMSE